MQLLYLFPLNTPLSVQISPSHVILGMKCREATLVLVLQIIPGAHNLQHVHKVSAETKVLEVLAFIELKFLFYQLVLLSLLRITFHLVH